MEMAGNLETGPGRFRQPGSEKAPAAMQVRAQNTSSRWTLQGQWTQNALRVMRERYLKRENGQVRETADGMFEPTRCS